MELSAPGLETARIRLEPLSESHREAIRASGAASEIWSSMPIIPSGTNMDAYFDHTLGMAEFGTGLGLVAMLQDSGDLAGLASFMVPNRLHRRLRIGYTWLEMAHRGSGLIDHIQYLMLRRALEWRARRVEWMFSTNNARALANLERLGATREGTLRAHSRFADGSWADLAVYSVIGDEIPAAMASLGANIGEAETAPGA